MNIFSKQDLQGVQEVIRSVNGHHDNSSQEKVTRDEAMDLHDQSQYIQELILEIDALPDNDAKELVQDCIQELLSFYGQGLERILGIISKGNQSAAKDIYNNLIEDKFISSLLLIHDLHPLDLNTRLHLALEKVKPYMDSHGGSVEVVSLHDGVAKLRLSGSCKGCPSSSSTLELGIKQAIEEICPDLIALEVEGMVAPMPNGEKNNHSLDAGWRTIQGLADMKNGMMKPVDIGSLSLMMFKVNQKMYAYRNHCPACDRSFSNGNLEDNIAGCQLGHKYDVVHAGICTDDPDLHLEPYPLLEENGIIKIAVA